MKTLELNALERLTKIELPPNAVGLVMNEASIKTRWEDITKV